MNKIPSKKFIAFLLHFYKLQGIDQNLLLNDREI